MLNWWLRYEPVLEFVRELDPSRVLDAGSGWHGLSWYWPGAVTNTDLAFAAEARPDERERRGTATFVTASVERLPFADGAFDLVVCLDLLEHLPPELRAPAVAELLRVGGRLVLGFPEGPTAAWTDRATDRLFGLARITRPTWLAEHLAIGTYPDEATLRADLPDGAVVERVVPNSNRWLHLGVILLEHHPGLARLPRALEPRAVRHGTGRLVHRGRAYRSVFLLRTP